MTDNSPKIINKEKLTNIKTKRPQRKSEEVVFTNLSTGEVCNIPVLLPSAPPPHPYSRLRGSGFIFACQDKLEEIALNKNLTGIDLRIIFIIMANLKKDNDIQITQYDLSKILNTTRSAISRSICKLRNAGILKSEIKNIGGYKRIYLSEECAWRGSNNELAKRLDVRIK